MLSGGSVLFTKSGWKSFHAARAKPEKSENRVHSYSDWEAVALNTMRVYPSKSANLRNWWLGETGQPHFNFKFDDFCTRAPLERVEAVGRFIWSSVFLRARNLEKYMQRRLNTHKLYSAFRGHVEYMKVLIFAANRLDAAVNSRKIS
jgi:hypothetical protein